MLFGSIGIPLNSMHCARSGMTIVSIASLPSCGPADATSEECALSDNCCDFSSSLLQLEVNAPEVKSGDNAFLTFFPLPQLLVSAGFPIGEDQPHFYTSDPPILTGRDILSLNQVYRI